MRCLSLTFGKLEAQKVFPLVVACHICPYSRLKRHMRKKKRFYSHHAHSIKTLLSAHYVAHYPTSFPHTGDGRLIDKFTGKVSRVSWCKLNPHFDQCDKCGSTWIILRIIRLKISGKKLEICAQVPRLCWRTCRSSCTWGGLGTGRLHDLKEKHG